MSKHKPHRSHNAHKQDILLLTCLFRLRLTPTMLYSSIASILIKTLPTPVSKLAKESEVKTTTPIPSSTIATSDPKQTVTDTEKEITTSTPQAEKPPETFEDRKNWLASQLEEMFDFAEMWESLEWKMACRWDGRLVGEMVRVLGLGGVYGVVGGEEMVVRIKWRREGDWRAGSEALGGEGGEVRERVGGGEDGWRGVGRGWRRGWRATIRKRVRERDELEEGVEVCLSGLEGED